MAYEIKGRADRNRPIRNDTPKREPRERQVWAGPLLPRLRPKDGFVQAVGFTANIIPNQEE